MVVLFHAGADCAYDEDDVKGTPKRFCNLHEQFPELKMILAHMGGYRLWEDVYRFLIGKNVYLDTAYTMEMENSALANLIKDHGADKILFGSDFPWERPSAIKGKIEECIKDETVRENIFHRNAEKLIGLDKK
jgi:predicted TIM-barrel fold metal-dependent hydrolase